MSKFTLVTYITFSTVTSFLYRIIETWPRKLLCISSTALQLSPFYQTTEQLSLTSALAQSVPTSPSSLEREINKDKHVASRPSNWKCIVTNGWVLNVVEYGYQIPLKNLPYQQKIPTNHAVNVAAHSVLVSEALDLKLKAVVSVVEPVNGQRCFCSLQRLCMMSGLGTRYSMGSSCCRVCWFFSPYYS